METFSYDGKSENLQKALDTHSQGGKVICYKCGSELLIFTERGEAAKHNLNPGIDCPKTKMHICATLFFMHEFEEFNKLFPTD